MQESKNDRSLLQWSMKIIVQAVKLVFLSVQWTVSNQFQMKNTNFLSSHQFKYGTMSVPVVKYVQESAQKMTWDAIRMLGTEVFEDNYTMEID